jgi:hypothetical protein
MALNTRDISAEQQQQAPSPSSTSFVSLTQFLGPAMPLQMQMLVPASPQLSPYVELSSRGTIIPNTKLSARCNPFQPTDQNGFVNASINLGSAEGLSALLGAWMSADSIHNLLQEQHGKHHDDDDHDAVLASWNQVAPSQPTPLPSTRNYSPSTIHVHGAANYQDAIVAAHAEIPLSANSGYVPEQLDTMLWINLSGGGNDQPNTTTTTTATTSSSNSSDQSPTTVPPLWLTLKQSTTRGHPPEYTLNLSQILTFDRKCWNILEDRAPYIRNHVGWTVQIRRNEERSSESQQSYSQWSVGTSWQINRNVAVKAVLDHNGRVLRTNLLLKKWQQPRITLSILGGIDWSTGQASFWGCGLEVETTTTAAMLLPPSPAAADKEGGGGDQAVAAGYQETVNLEGIRAPPTKIQVPLKKQTSL